MIKQGSNIYLKWGAERGLNYSAARYYNSAVSLWTSVDPLADKYPNLSPYTYCANNPVRLVDADGNLFTNFEDENGNLIKHIEDGSNAVFRVTDSKTGKFYAFSGYDESQGGANMVNIGTAIQEQQLMNLDNPALQQSENGTTYCNYATQNVMKTVSSVPDYGDALVTGNANTMSDKLGNHPNYIAVNKDQAVEYGKTGLAVVAYKNTNGGHGHVATFSAGNNDGEVVNIGPQKYTGFKTVNQAISPLKAKDYYIYVPGHVFGAVTIK